MLLSAPTSVRSALRRLLCAQLAHGRNPRSLRGSHAGTLTRFDKSLRASGGQTRGVPGITTAMNHSIEVEPLGDENQFDRVKAGMRFAQHRLAGMTVATIEMIFRQRSARMKSSTCRDACRGSEILRRFNGRSTWSLSMQESHRPRRDAGVGAVGDAARALH